MLLYSDGKAVRRGRPVPYDEQPALAYWIGHYRNFRVLAYIKQHGNLTQQRRAEHEMRICDAKMMHWQRHKNWDAKEAARARVAIDAHPHCATIALEAVALIYAEQRT